MSAVSVTVTLFVAGLAFLVGSVYYNKKTGWKRSARKDDWSSLMLWAWDLKHRATTDPSQPARPATAPVVLELVPNPQAASGFSTSLASLQTSLLAASGNKVTSPEAPVSPSVSDHATSPVR